jgi:hypothetical protein
METVLQYISNLGNLSYWDTKTCVLVLVIQSPKKPKTPDVIGSAFFQCLEYHETMNVSLFNYFVLQCVG